MKFIEFINDIKESLNPEINKKLSQTIYSKIIQNFAKIYANYS